MVGQETLAVSAARFDAIDFVSYRRESPARVNCGPQTPPREVFVTWRPARAANQLGTAVAVELLPEGYVPTQ